MGKPLVLSPNFQDMWWSTLDNLRNVGKPSIFSVHYEVRTHSGKKPSECKNYRKALKPSMVPVLFKTMRSFIMESRPMNVRNVGELSVVSVHSKYREEFIL